MPVTVKSRLPQIAASLSPRAKAVTRAGAELVSHRAKDRVHVETGKLRAAIHVEEAQDGHAVVAGGGEVFYGHLEEFGTAHSPAHPFLIPAAEESLSEIEAVAVAALRSL